MSVKFSNSNPPAPGGDDLVNFQIDPTTGEISASYTPGGGGGGTVTTTGSPASGNLTKFSGASSITNGDLSGDVATAGTLGTVIQTDAVTTSKILNAAVTEAKIGLSNNTTNDVSISQHGFAPIAPNDATQFLNGVGGYSTPAGTGVSAATLATAGQGYFFGPGIMRPLLTNETTGNGLTPTANKVVICQMDIAVKMTVRNCTWQKNSGTSGKHHSFGIYDVSGNLLVAAAFTNTATASLVETISFTGVILNPGCYYFAQVDEDTLTTGICSTAASATAWGAVLNKVATRYATAANAATAGALPSTLGALTALTPALWASAGIALPMWEP